MCNELSRIIKNKYPGFGLFGGGLPEYAREEMLDCLVNVESDVKKVNDSYQDALNRVEAVKKQKITEYNTCDKIFENHYKNPTVPGISQQGRINKTTVKYANLLGLYTECLEAVNKNTSDVKTPGF